MTDEILEIDSVSGIGVPTHGNDIDTGQIIPAWFTKVVTFDGLGGFAFFDQRYDKNDESKDHPLNEPQFQDASTMIVSANFGCGSPREYTLQALMYWGIGAIVGGSFAEIFVGNCPALGIPTVIVDHKTVIELQDWVDEHPDGDTDVDVENEAVTYGDTTVNVTADDAQRKALTEGVWDTTTLMKSNVDTVTEKAAALPHVDDRENRRYFRRRHRRGDHPDGG